MLVLFRGYNCLRFPSFNLRCSSHNTKFTILKCTIQSFFWYIHYVVSLSHYVILEYFHYPKRNPLLIISPNTYFLQLLKISNLLLVSVATAAKSLQSCPTLCDPIDGSPPGSTIPGILQARTLEWSLWVYLIQAFHLNRICGLFGQILCNFFHLQ